MKKYLIVLLAGLFSLSLSAQTYKLTDPIPMDPSIRTGVLPNGLTYYIHHNENPKNSASFYIIQNVGAILENDNQNGLAHFLEHMAFNGTVHFPGKNLLNLLEKNGVKFGKDVNAYTAKNETVYNMSNVPVKNNGLIDSCLLILSDWSHSLLLTTDEINSERGVITEEWRTRRNSSFRIQQQLGPVVYNGAKYAYRDVIGDLNVIKTFDPAVIRTFYHDWYRTDLQAIAIVGDIDVDQVEAKVKQLFSAIPAVENPQERPFVVIPDNDQPLFTVATDKDIKSATISLSIRRKESSDNTLDNIRKNYLYGCFNSLMAARFREMKQDNDVPFMGADVKISGLERGYLTLNIDASAREGKEAAAFTTVYSELQRVIQHGFTQSEFDRIIKMMSVKLENDYKRQSEVTNDAFCKAIKSAYLHKICIPETEFSYPFEKYVLQTLTAQEVANVLATWLTPNNRVFSIVRPEGWSNLSQVQLQDIVDGVNKSNLAAHVDNVPVGELMDGVDPKGGSIRSEKRNALFGDVEWTLSNGAKVIFKKVDNDAENVVLTAYSYGGSSLYGAKDLPNIVNLPDFVRDYGLGNFDAINFKKLQAGNTASCGLSIDSYEEDVAASSTKNDLETMFQMVYLRFEKPRFDKNVYDMRIKENWDRLKLQNLASNIMKDTMEAILMNNHPRMRRFNKSYLEDMSFERMEQIYKERFADASDFTFIITGNVEEDSIKPFVCKYIGSITDLDRKETWVNHHIKFPKGKTQRDIVIPMSSYKSSVLLRMNRNAPYTRKNIIYQTILGSILTLRFTEEIREKEGGTYGVDVRPSIARLPNGQMGLAISFDCDPEKAKHLRALVYKELEKVQKSVSEADLNKVVLNLKKSKEQTKKDERYWSGILTSYYKYGENRLDPAFFDAIVNKVTPQDIETAARYFFRHANVVDVIFYPEPAKE